MSTHTKILHVDGDAFFASCESAQYPHLLGKPVVVGEERGIACAFSYEAKKLGITRGMPIAHIRANFPRVVILPSHFDLYHEYADKLYRVLREFTTRVERYSIDECFASVSQRDIKKYGSTDAYMKHVKKVAQEKLGITFSFGLAETKVLAKLASKYDKPNGLTIIERGTEEQYLKNTNIEDVWGIGYRTSPLWHMRGIHTAFDFVSIPKDTIDTFDKPTQILWYELTGHRVHTIAEEGDETLPASLQATRTFRTSQDKKLITSELSRNTELVSSRLREHGLVARGIRFFIKNSDFKYTSRECELPFYTSDPSDFQTFIESAIDTMLISGEKYRSTGITLFSFLPHF